VSRLSRIQHRFVDFIPERLEEGVLYVSRRYRTASHLCCCGCGLEVVTPLNEAKWQATERDGGVWLRPSVGNWSFPCQSHYWIDGGRVRWAGRMSADDIAGVRRRDRRDADRLVADARLGARLRRGLAAAWARIVAALRPRC
jgi:hypothetical protein